MSSMVDRFGDYECGEWSTVVDAPVGPILGCPTAVAVFGPSRAQRAEEHVTSQVEYRLKEIQQLLVSNRTGDGDTELDLDGSRQKYGFDVDSVRGTSRIVSFCDLVFIRDPEEPGPYLLKSRFTEGGFVSDGELESLIESSDTVVEVFGSDTSWNVTIPTIVKDERGFIADAAQ